jgi:hypothetical protein
MMALDRAAQELNSAREEAIENDRDVPFLGYSGARSETGSMRSFGSGMLGGGRAPSVVPSLFTVDRNVPQEVKEKGKGGRKPDTSDQKIQRRFAKYKQKGVYSTIYQKLTADEKADLQDIIAEYEYRNPVKTPQKTASKKIGEMGDISEVDSDA